MGWVPDNRYAVSGKAGLVDQAPRCLQVKASWRLLCAAPPLKLAQPLPRRDVLRRLAHMDQGRAP